MLTLAIFVALVGMVMLGVPIFAAMGLTAAGTFILLGEAFVLPIMAQRMYMATTGFIAFFAMHSLDLTLSVGRASPILSWPMTWWYVTMPVAGFIMLAYSIRNIVVGVARLTGREIGASGKSVS
jgi:TRAP-type C4-dicarboxylate transport system permease small subunit